MHKEIKKNISNFPYNQLKSRMFQISCSSNLNTIYNNSNEILTSIQNTNSTTKKNKSNSKKKKFNFQYFKHRKKLNSMKSFHCLSTSASPKNKKIYLIIQFIKMKIIIQELIQLEVKKK